MVGLITGKDKGRKAGVFAWVYLTKDVVCVWRYVNSTLSHEARNMKTIKSGMHTHYIYSTKSAVWSTVLFAFNDKAGMWQTMVRLAEPALKHYNKPGFHCSAMQNFPAFSLICSFLTHKGCVCPGHFKRWILFAYFFCCPAVVRNQATLSARALSFCSWPKPLGMSGTEVEALLRHVIKEDGKSCTAGKASCRTVIHTTLRLTLLCLLSFSDSVILGKKTKDHKRGEKKEMTLTNNQNSIRKFYLIICI